MTAFAVDTALLLFVAYAVGCGAGCWLRRSFSRR